MKVTFSKGSWTRFWKSLKVDLARENQWTAKETYSRDFRRLRRLGVDDIVLKKVQKKFEKYEGGHLQFHRYSYFFAKDPETVRRWTNTASVSSAYLKGCNVLLGSTNVKAKSRLSELLVLMELYRKREIIEYEAKFTKAFSTISVTGRSLLSTLKLGEATAGFKIEKELVFDGYKVFCISKKTGGSQKVYKFILYKKVKNKLLIVLALDTPEERRKILGHLSRKIGIIIDRLKDEPDLARFIDFIKNGATEKFTLISADMLSEGYKISVAPQFGRPDNIASSDLYQQVLPDADIEILESISRLKIIHSSTLGPVQVHLRFLNSKNEDIIGGMKVVLDAKGLSISKREALKTDFIDDFAFHLDTPLVFEASEEEIYKKFLQNPPKKKKRIEIISNKAIEISNKLSVYKLLPQDKRIEEAVKICTYHGCPKKFRSQWVTENVCDCGNNLWIGSVIVTQVIEEKVVRDFIQKIATDAGYTCTPLARDLLNRKIFPIEIIKDGESVCLIPITTSLKSQQLEVLKYRYPNLVFITSKTDHAALSVLGFKVERLYKLVHNLFDNPNTEIDRLLSIVSADRSTRIRDLSDVSAGRFLDEQWYLDQGNIGPEFFEADATMLLNYIFKNSIWLGANRRGEKLPDSFSAFPFDNTGRGCFISDSKFSRRATPDIGTIDKNKKYLLDGKKNVSVRGNGGLRGFIFIGNKPAPANFITKMKRVVQRKIVNAGYLTNKQLLLIYNHLKHWEHDFEVDGRKRNIFLDSMEEIFLASRTSKFVVWTDDAIEGILNRNVEQYRALSSPDLTI